MKDEQILLSALETLEIPATVGVRLVKSKKTPVHSTLVSYRPSQEKGSTFNYSVEYRKSLSQSLLRHELCHLKLHLMGLPAIEVEGPPADLTGQVLNTLHEDYYASLMMHQRFLKDFLSSFMKGLSRDDHHIHIHEEVDDNLLAWLLQNYALKLAVLETLGYRNEAEEVRERIEDLGESHRELQKYLVGVAESLRSLPPLDAGLRPFTAEERDSISRAVMSIVSTEVPLLTRRSATPSQ
ncbi:MAG: hypothetical protein QW828_02845 [Candidatus Bathyarchaeia archaeon]